MGKKEELRIRQQKNFLEEVINAQQEMICRFLPDTTLIFVNQAYCRYMGLPEENSSAPNGLISFPKESRRPYLTTCEKLARREKSSITSMK
jgi:PAS domain-containing protein